MSERWGTPVQVVMAMMYRGRILRNLERLAEAQAELDVALTRLRALVDEDPTLARELFVERAHVATAQGNHAAARREVDAAEKLR